MKLRWVYTGFIMALLLAHLACGHGQRALFAPNPDVAAPVAALEQPVVEWPAGLPVDAVQPWERVDGGGRIASSINLDSEFVPGVEWFTAPGGVTELGEAAGFASGAAGEEAVSYAIYRIPLGSGQPGTMAADVNLHAGGAYYLGVADYSANTWRWHGPFAAPHVRIALPHYEYTSTLGNLFIAVVAYDGAAFDLVGLGVNARDDGDTAAPDAPGAPELTPVAGGLHVRWLQVDAEDLAGYRVYADGEEALGYVEGGETVVIPASAETEITLTSIDLSGNESEASEPSIAIPLAGDIPAIELTASAASGGRHAVIELTATGAETYDWDVDGDGDWDITGDTAGTATASTASYGLIRPALRGHTADGGFALSAVSLIIAGNSRPVVSVTASPQSGPAPLSVDFTITAEDDDGTIEEYAWDVEGDGIYDDVSPVNPGMVPYIYTLSGTYNAKFRVTDNEGAWDVDTMAVQVLPDPANQTPVIDAINAAPALCTPGTLVHFTASASDPDGSIATWGWDFDGDGSDDAAEQNPTHTFDEAGFYNVRLTVGDDQGGYAVGYVGVSVQETVPNVPPVAILTADETVFHLGETGEASVGFDASGSYDPDGGSLTYYFDPEGDGSYVNNGSDATYDASYFYSGLHQAKGKVTDDASASAYDTVLISIYRFGSTTVDSAGLVGEFTSLAIVNGNPAISYYDTTTNDLKFVRATDANGSAWGAPSTPDSVDDVGQHTSLAVVSVMPAISYYDATNGTLKYVRATDGNGSSWGAPITVDSAGIVGEDTSLAVVNGRPAIAYYDATNSGLKYVRATDASGSTWGTPITIDSAGGWHTSLAIVNGNPAISYYVLSGAIRDLKYVRATDSDGSSWGTPITIDSPGDVGRYTSLVVVNGNPAISYYDVTNGNVKFVRATDSDGSTWGTPLILDSAGDVGRYTSLVVVNGNPAISYCDYGKYHLKFAYPRLD